MNITINSQKLAEHLRLVCKAVPAKPAIQILGHVLLKAEPNGEAALGPNGTLRVSASDLDVSIVSTSHEAEVNEAGAVALSASRLLALVEQFPDADVSIGAVDGTATIKCRAFTTQLQTLPAADFPPLPDPVEGGTSLDADALCRTIARTRHAVSTLTTKFVLQGALLTLSKSGGAVMVATNGKTLALATMPQEGGEATAVVPTKMLDVLAGQTGIQEFRFAAGDRHLFFTAKDRVLISRRMDGEFPKYERAIPRANDKIATVDRHALAAALRRINLVAGESRGIYMLFEAGKILLSSKAFGIGEAEEMLVVTYDAAPLRLCVNGDLILEFLDACVGDEVRVMLKDERSAVLLMDGDDCLNVLMPMKG